MGSAPPPTPVPDPAPTTPHETEVVRGLAAKYRGQVEARLWDDSRVDLLTADEAIEADWAHKWPEGVGQALYYALVTGRRPGLMLLVRDPSAESRFVYRAQAVCARHGITLHVEIVRPPEAPK